MRHLSLDPKNLIANKVGTRKIHLGALRKLKIAIFMLKMDFKVFAKNAKMDISLRTKCA